MLAQRNGNPSARYNGSYPCGTVSNGEPLQVIMRQPTHERLRSTCFRGAHIQKAGNFFRWETLAALIRELKVDIQAWAHELIAERVQDPQADHSTEESCEIECGMNVGWSSTDSLESYEREELEPFKPNARSTGLRLRRDSKRCAPQTRLVTLVC